MSRSRTCMTLAALAFVSLDAAAASAGARKVLAKDIAPYRTAPCHARSCDPCKNLQKQQCLEEQACVYDTTVDFEFENGDDAPGSGCSSIDVLNRLTLGHDEGPTRGQVLARLRELSCGDMYTRHDCKLAAKSGVGPCYWNKCAGDAADGEDDPVGYPYCSADPSEEVKCIDNGPLFGISSTWWLHGAYGDYSQVLWDDYTEQMTVSESADPPYWAPGAVIYFVGEKATELFPLAQAPIDYVECYTEGDRDINGDGLTGEYNCQGQKIESVTWVANVEPAVDMAVFEFVQNGANYEYIMCTDPVTNAPDVNCQFQVDQDTLEIEVIKADQNSGPFNSGKSCAVIGMRENRLRQLLMTSGDCAAFKADPGTDDWDWDKVPPVRNQFANKKVYDNGQDIWDDFKKYVMTQY